MAVIDFSAMTNGLSSAMAGINNVTVGDMAGNIAMGVLAGAMTTGIKAQLGGLLPNLNQPANPAHPAGDGPTATAAALGAMPPAAQAAFFAANGHVIG